MEENLITKKDLLELTGISYGSLYRWKRKKLLPDEWFIHRATFTGQETFFPREKILERVEKIKALKDELSLDEIAETFSATLRPLAFSPADAVDAGVAARPSIELYLSLTGRDGPYDFEQLLRIYVVDQLLRSGDLSREDVQAALRLLADSASSEAELQMVILRKLGVTICMLADNGDHYWTEPDVKVLVRKPLAEWTHELKEILNRGVQNG